MNPDCFEDQQELSYQPRITKKVILQQRDDFQTAEETTIMFYYNPAEREIDFGKSMNEFFMNEYNNLKICQVFYYDFSTKYYTFLGIYPFQKEAKIKYQDFQQQTIHIKYHTISYEDEEPEIKSKKQRVKQRSINDVLRLVSEWRDTHTSKKITLELAAQEVGLPKKTLDDYYQQIKLAETYLFDFEQNLNKGIGVLRKFVKEKHQKKKTIELDILKKYSDKVKHKKQQMDDSSQEEQEQQQEEEGE